MPRVGIQNRFRGGGAQANNRFRREWYQSGETETASTWPLRPSPAGDFPAAGTSRRCKCKRRFRCRPIASIICVSSFPARPTNGNPCASSSAPGPFAHKHQLGFRIPVAEHDFVSRLVQACTGCNRQDLRESSVACRPSILFTASNSDGPLPRRQTTLPAQVRRAVCAARPSASRLGKVESPRISAVETVLAGASKHFSRASRPHLRRALYKTDESPGLRSNGAGPRFFVAGKRAKRSGMVPFSRPSGAQQAAPQNAAHAHALRPECASPPRPWSIVARGISRPSRENIVTMFVSTSNPAPSAVTSLATIKSAFFSSKLFPRVFRHVIRLRGKPHHHLLAFFLRRRCQNVRVRLQPNRQRLIRPLDFGRRGRSRPIIRHRRGKHRNRRASQIALSPPACISSAERTSTRSVPSGVSSAVGPLTRITFAPRCAAASATA